MSACAKIEIAETCHCEGRAETVGIIFPGLRESSEASSTGTPGLSSSTCSTGAAEPVGNRRHIAEIEGRAVGLCERIGAAPKIAVEEAAGGYSPRPGSDSRAVACPASSSNPGCVEDDVAAVDRPD
jgi:hypothetical protein